MSISSEPQKEPSISPLISLPPPNKRSISPILKPSGYLPQGVSPIVPTRFSSLSLISRGNSISQFPFFSVSKGINTSPNLPNSFFRKYKMRTPPTVVFPMGEVREGYEIVSNRKVLIKFFFKPFFSEEELDSLRTEFFPVPELRHPNLLEAVDFHETPAQIIAVSEYFEGQSLESLIADHKTLPPNTAALITFQISQALQHLHSHSLAHRDLKLANILFDGVTAKLVLTSQLAHFTPKTEFKICIGSPHYLAPEVLKEAYDYRADIWALGVVLYWVLAGRPPFNAFEEDELFRKILEEDPNFSRSPLKPFEALLRGMLDKSKRKRITLKEIVEDKKLILLVGIDKKNAEGLKSWEAEGLAIGEVKKGWARLLAENFLRKAENEKEAKKQFETHLRNMKKEEKSSLKISKPNFKTKFSLSSELIKKSTNLPELERQSTQEIENKTISDIRDFCVVRFPESIFSNENAEDLFGVLTLGGQDLKTDVLREKLILANKNLNLEENSLKLGKSHSIKLMDFLDLCKENIPRIGNTI